MASCGCSSLSASRAWASPDDLRTQALARRKTRPRWARSGCRTGQAAVAAASGQTSFLLLHLPKLNELEERVDEFEVPRCRQKHLVVLWTSHSEISLFCGILFFFSVGLSCSFLFSCYSCLIHFYFMFKSCFLITALIPRSCFSDRRFNECSYFRNLRFCCKASSCAVTLRLLSINSGNTIP